MPQDFTTEILALQKEVKELKELFEGLEAATGHVVPRIRFDEDRWIKGAEFEYNEQPKEIPGPKFVPCNCGKHIGHWETCPGYEKQSWPQKGNEGFCLRIDLAEGLVVWRTEYDPKNVYPLGFYKTREDAEIMRDCYYAQQLDWMPEEGEEWWRFAFSITSPGTPEETKRSYTIAKDIAEGNVHRTKKEAQKYGELREKDAEIKLKYLKLKKGV